MLKTQDEKGLSWYAYCCGEGMQLWQVMPSWSWSCDLRTCAY
jgi:hypothetical protein